MAFINYLLPFVCWMASSLAPPLNQSVGAAKTWALTPPRLGFSRPLVFFFIEARPGSKIARAPGPLQFQFNDMPLPPGARRASRAAAAVQQVDKAAWLLDGFSPAAEAGLCCSARGRQRPRWCATAIH